MRIWRLFAPLPAIAVGIAIAGAHDVRWTAFVPNLIAVVLGIAVTCAIRTRRAEGIAAWLPIVAAIAIVCTLAGPDVDGVHRWLAIGGMRVNVSTAAAPWLLLGLAAAGRRARILGALAVLVAQVAHVLQPDAGQATALAAGMLPLVLDRRAFAPGLGIPLALAAGSLAAAAWFVPDPLAAVDHVERILVLGAAMGGVSIAVLAAAWLVALLPFAHPFREPWRDPVALALVAYTTATFAVTWLGSFPVPLFGAGAGPVLGWYALLAIAARRSPDPRRSGARSQPTPAPRTASEPRAGTSRRRGPASG